MEEKIITYCNYRSIIYIKISTENIETVYNILFNNQVANFYQCDEILYYYALYCHINNVHDEAFTYYKYILAKNTASSQIIGCVFNNMGVMYKNGDYLQFDINRAIEYFELGTEKNIHCSFNHLGNIYSNINIHKTIEMYQKGRELGNYNSIKNLANLYKDGRIFDKNVNDAIEIYEQAIEKGFYKACWDLADIYKSKGFYNKPFDIAFKLYEMAINTNNHHIMDSLGHMTQIKNGIIVNHEKTLQLFHMALNKNNSTASFCIGLMYSSGFGVSVDLNLAAKYFSIYCKQYNYYIGQFVNFKNIDWNYYLHECWPISTDLKNILNKQIVILLLVSKSRHVGKSNKFFVKGICMIVIKFIMQHSLNN